MTQNYMLKLIKDLKEGTTPQNSGRFFGTVSYKDFKNNFEGYVAKESYNAETKEIQISFYPTCKASLAIEFMEAGLIKKDERLVRIARLKKEIEENKAIPEKRLKNYTEDKGTNAKYMGYLKSPMLNVEFGIKKDWTVEIL
jgi:hypothetical protein